VVFGAAKAKSLRDPSNTSGDLREVFDRLGCEQCGGRGWHGHLKTPKQRARPPRARGGWNEPCDATPPFAWVHSHIFRKTVLTRLDEAGLTPRQLADYAGHRRPSMTQDVYMGRNVVSADAARVLDR
jgi:integrase